MENKIYTIKDSRISQRVPAALAKRLETASQKHGITKANLVRQAVALYLDRIEKTSVAL